MRGRLAIALAAAVVAATLLQLWTHAALPGAVLRAPSCVREAAPASGPARNHSLPAERAEVNAARMLASPGCGKERAVDAASILQFAVKVLTYQRAASLQRLLDSLHAADYCGVRGALPVCERVTRLRPQVWR